MAHVYRVQYPHTGVEEGVTHSLRLAHRPPKRPLYSSNSHTYSPIKSLQYLLRQNKELADIDIYIGGTIRLSHLKGFG